ncbi:unnamed protein product [Rhizoctonia solani]|uniref:Uncharacterized protein n=1 Tax=Rhizoctonia solani TaxID=456999 RepID=A0A8H3HKD7_9AGAM|nr:unnamed protein product [Rhizoctonia solani]
MLQEFLTRLFPSKKNEKRILIVGLDYTGKTRFLYRMHLGETVTTIPTIWYVLICFNIETVKVPTSGCRSSLHLTCWDVGGCDKIRPLLRHYTAGTEALIWVLNSNDRERLPEVIAELKIILGIVEGERGEDANLVPCLILANKKDLQACTVFAASPISDNFLSAITPAMDWLYDIISGEQLEECRLQNLKPHVQVFKGLAEKLNSWVEQASTDQQNSLKHSRQLAFRPGIIVHT